MLTVTDLPEPPKIPLLGHLLALGRGVAMHRVLHDWRDVYGPTYRIRFGRTPLVVTSSPEVVQTVLRDGRRRSGGLRRWHASSARWVLRGCSTRKARTGAGCAGSRCGA
ncbi:cytochrome P450 [Streptomyces bauhiniae]|uniref:cytochrome P450 n=1 Tax=Streptomyces bauhiniae TaxID=2340725 RepID=UPI003657E561